MIGHWRDRFQFWHFLRFTVQKQAEASVLGVNAD
jgi:hypothetical protein